MRFVSLKVSREHRYAIGSESIGGRPYLSIPVANRMVDYQEYYLLTDEEFASFSVNDKIAADFAQRCGRRELDDRLIIAPGTDRGVY